MTAIRISNRLLRTKPLICLHLLAPGKRRERHTCSARSAPSDVSTLLTGIHLAHASRIKTTTPPPVPGSKSTLRSDDGPSTPLSCLPAPLPRRFAPALPSRWQPPQQQVDRGAMESQQQRQSRSGQDARAPGRPRCRQDCQPQGGSARARRVHRMCTEYRTCKVRHINKLFVLARPMFETVESSSDDPWGFLLFAALREI